MQAIETKFVPPTSTRTGMRGPFVVARAQAGRLRIQWDDRLGLDGNHDAAARAFAVKWGWSGTWHRGGKADGTGNVYVCTTSLPRGAAFEVRK